MKNGIIAVSLGVIAGITAYHLYHHEKYCKYKGVKGKSHCHACSHRPVCQKYHKKKWK